MSEKKSGRNQRQQQSLQRTKPAHGAHRDLTEVSSDDYKPLLRSKFQSIDLCD
jgi:hypothetical protein